MSGKFRIENLLSSLHITNHTEWSYTGDCGPQTWKNVDGKYQSPIDIGKLICLFFINKITFLYLFKK